MPQGSVLGPVLFLIYVSDIEEGITVFVDDTKLRGKVTEPKDVESNQEKLIKLHDWGNKNNMEFNGKKFQVVRYGPDASLKEDTTYFYGDYDECLLPRGPRGSADR